MRILVIGAGVIGTIYGWAFSEAGHEVTHFVHPGKAARFAAGIPMDVLDSRKGYKKHFVGRTTSRQLKRSLLWSPSDSTN